MLREIPVVENFLETSARKFRRRMMKGNKPMKPITNIIYPAFTLTALVCFALLPAALAVVPAPDGGYPNNNTAEGQDALFSLTTGVDNTAIGFQALYSDTTTGGNTAVGSQALMTNTTGIANTAIGDLALWQNSTGPYNTAMGFLALWNNTTGDSNTAIGNETLTANTGGHANTAIGASTLNANTGSYNTGSGFQALFRNTIGSNNTALGRNALKLNTVGSNNTALGNAAGFNLTTGSNNIDIGNLGVADEANTIRIGGIGNQTNTFIAGISGATVPGGVGVIIDSSGHMGTIVSSERFKDSIKPMDKASEAILALQPVTFCYKKELDPDGIPQFGLVAEQVENVNPDLVAHDEQGKPYTVRYDAVNAMLLNEFLKEHRKVQELEAHDAQQQNTIKALTAMVKEQASQIQKVSAQIELSKSVEQTVSNEH
jgi:trimeric autotransporter adhesin